jgi:putative transposase
MSTLGAADILISRHELYDRLGRSDLERQSAYRQLFRAQLSGVEVEAIREATNKNWALGNERFKRQIAKMAGRRVAPLPKAPPTTPRTNIS